MIENHVSGSARPCNGGEDKGWGRGISEERDEKGEIVGRR